MSQVVQFEKIVPEGKAMGRLKDGRAVFAIGPLPGETARVGLRKQKRHYAEAVLHEILDPSPQRGTPPEDHCQICSPWQGVDYDYQIELKTEMLREAYRQHHLQIELAEFITAPDQLGYRNRLDFTLAPIEGRLQLAFHQRGSWENLVSLPHGCALGSQAMNQAATELADQLNAHHFPAQEAVITARQSHTNGHILLILTTDAQKFDWPALTPPANASLLVARPLPGSGAPGELIYHHGAADLTEELAGTTINYPYNSFFQTNVPVFRQALNRIVEAAEPHHNILELYSGVGSIGLPLAKAGHTVTGVEIVPTAVEYAGRNADANHITTYREHVAPAETMEPEIFIHQDCVIVDPPRAGLHPKVIKRLLEAAPKRIIYLSCNPVTQARDLSLLQSVYTPGPITAFDFYPGTLHMESLAVLDRTSTTS